jgi:hypothetical protein
MVEGQRLVWQMIINYQSCIKESSDKICQVAKAVGIVGNPYMIPSLAFARGTM